jgi:hypothetical protein
LGFSAGGFSSARFDNPKTLSNNDIISPEPDKPEPKGQDEGASRKGAKDAKGNPCVLVLKLFTLPFFAT